MTLQDLMLYAKVDTVFVLHDTHRNESWNGKYVTVNEKDRIPYKIIKVTFFEATDNGLIHVYGYVE